jgi:hypothetical protein
MFRLPDRPLTDVTEFPCARLWVRAGPPRARVRRRPAGLSYLVDPPRCPRSCGRPGGITSTGSVGPAADPVGRGRVLRVLHRASGSSPRPSRTAAPGGSRWKDPFAPDYRAIDARGRLRWWCRTRSTTRACGVDLLAGRGCSDAGWSRPPTQYPGRRRGPIRRYDGTRPAVTGRRGPRGDRDLRTTTTPEFRYDREPVVRPPGARPDRVVYAGSASKNARARAPAGLAAGSPPRVRWTAAIAETKEAVDQVCRRRWTSLASRGAAGCQARSTATCVRLRPNLSPEARPRCSHPSGPWHLPELCDHRRRGGPSTWLAWPVSPRDADEPRIIVAADEAGHRDSSGSRRGGSRQARRG